MHAENIPSLTVRKAADLLASREASSTELTNAVLNRISRVEETIRAFVTVTKDMAIKQADQADARIATGNAHQLTGIPMQLKDNMCTRGISTTCSSLMLKTYLPTYDATVTKRLFDEGAVLIGKGNLDEFAMGSSTENSAFFPTHNPWDGERVPGGSSGGPAAAVAAGECIYALGSDTGGSIRQPASFCGIVGLKPTYGVVSRYGLVAFASSLDQIGPLTKDVTDAAIVLNTIAGHDPHDSTSIPFDVPDYTAALGKEIKGLKIGIPKEYFVEGVQPEVRDAVNVAISVFENLGASVSETSLPTSSHAMAVYYIIAPSEASANLARYDGVKYGYSAADTGRMWDALDKTRQDGFGPEVKRRIMLGTYALSTGYYDAYYLKAQKVRTLIRREFDQAFDKFDAIVTPTTPTVGFKLGEKTSDPVQMYLNDIFTQPANIAGIPAISVPCGIADGLPIGLQIMTNHMAEDTLLQLAYAYEQATEWHLEHPQI
ncbi:MAG: Asp-tRNA(Asn)/Glu-tRNA(Gln) amidotransferase subunit GatA [SAR202 cluster bacterium]|jgi:aspartyl-tRNA(Asn)/glutamyl-tRNA(Gln) amidotransferase subunit A|nr:Asp-tRNA(Asn)/Glu-tRNA(Gln) amidotransferase subunit GatA [SAR202 cluster bacterium]